MHTDEAVHAVKFDTLWQTGRYEYDPNEYHGPTLYYFTLPAMWLSGAQNLAQTDEFTFRITPALFGAGLTLLLLLLADGLGRGATIVAALLMALSPAMVFYSRYYIQEMLLAFFTLGAIAAGWRFVRSPRIGWAILLGCMLGLMHATKETSVIAFGCMGLAIVATLGWRRFHMPNVDTRVSNPRQALLLIVIAVAAVATSALFFSGFLTHPRGVWDSLAALTTYFQRAGGGGVHEHPWHYYFGILLFTHYSRGPIWTEALIPLLALAGVAAVARQAADSDAISVAQLKPACGLAPRRFLVIYAALMVLVYSIIPYKTPWCGVQFLVPMALLAGIGAAALLRALWPERAAELGGGRPARRIALLCVSAALLLSATGHLGWQAWRASFRFYADYRNPYVYAHPLLGVVQMSDWVEKLARVHPDGHGMLIRVIMDDPWPVPWYLRRFEQVGYWESPPADCEAPVIITSADLAPQVESRLRREYRSSYYGLRPDVVLVVYVAHDLWEAFAAREVSGEW